jgi:hypothetical protein
LLKKIAVYIFSAFLFAKFKQGDFLDFFLYVLYSVLLHLPPPRFYFFGGISVEINRKNRKNINDFLYSSTCHLFYAFYAEQGAKYKGMRSGFIPPSLLLGIMYDPEFLRIPTIFSSVFRYF